MLFMLMPFFFAAAIFSPLRFICFIAAFAYFD